MPRIYVLNHVTLDGVVQGPGRKEEDTRDGFDLGGWATERVDDVLMGATFSRVSAAGGLRLLLGRRSYEGMLGYWNTQDSPFKAGLNDAQKFIVSNTLHDPLPWPNSTLLAGNAVESVTALKRAPGGDLCIMGSGQLVQALLHAQLIDELLLFIHPIVLGRGRHMFADGSVPASLELSECRANTKGVIIANYRRPHSEKPAGSSRSP